MTNCVSKSKSGGDCTSTTIQEEGEKLKPCCVCPETRKARDECVLRIGPENDICKMVIEAHNACLASYGFKMQ